MKSELPRFIDIYLRTKNSPQLIGGYYSLSDIIPQYYALAASVPGAEFDRLSDIARLYQRCLVNEERNIDYFDILYVGHNTGFLLLPSEGLSKSDFRLSRISFVHKMANKRRSQDEEDFGH